MKRARTRTLTVLSLLLVGCPGSSPSADGDDGSTGQDGTTGTDGEPTVGADETSAPMGCEEPEAAVAAILAESCGGMGCHGDMAAAGLSLVGPDWIDQLVGQPSSLCEGWIRVVPGDPAASVLVDKLGAMPACGVPMPVGGSLEASRIECIEQWIAGLPPIDCETCGGEACVDTMTDAAHCGACDSPCPAGVACMDGACACPEGTMACGDACVDPLANGEHCGGCDNPCTGGEVCLAGVCVADCGALTECAGGCVNTDTDPLHCGGCDSPCGPGAECVGGSCSCGGDPVSYAADIEPMMVADCTGMGCHGFPLPQEGLDLRAGNGYAGMVGQPSAQCAGQLLVEPGQPGSSYLVNKLTGVDMCFGTSMPKGLGAWTPDRIDLVSAWICQGAPM